MSATVCRLMAETAITLKLTPPPPQESDSKFSNWGCRSKESLENYGIYSDPLRERSRLSARSLEMCTENLGSETGTDTISDGFFSSFDQERSLSTSGGNYQEKLRSRVMRQNRNEEGKFPPPLTTMSGTGSIQVRRHCEGGRLIIEAVERPLRNSCLQAERSGGRLRLCYLTDSDSDSDIDAAEEEEEEEDAEVGAGFESKTEEFEFQIWSRCKERRGHEHGGLCSSNWKPAFWVATS